MTTNVSPLVLQPGAQLTASGVAYVTGPANSQVIVKNAVFTNVGTAATTITAWRVASGGTAGATNEIIPGRTIAVGGTDRAPELVNVVLNAGDEIVCAAGAVASVNFFAFGFVAT
jgi:hypothetical protein